MFEHPVEVRSIFEDLTDIELKKTLILLGADLNRGRIPPDEYLTLTKWINEEIVNRVIKR